MITKIPECQGCGNFMATLNNCHFKFCPYCGMELAIREVEPRSDIETKLMVLRHTIIIDVPWYGSDHPEDINEILTWMDPGDYPHSAMEQFHEKWAKDYEIIPIDTAYKVRRHHIEEVIPYRDDPEVLETCEDIALSKIERGIWTK